MLPVIESLCARCARHQRTCCQDTDIVVTSGDVRRIAAEAGRAEFVEYRAVGDPVYADQDDDPIWRERVIRPDGTRRVLQQQPNGDCIFLGPQGCLLSSAARPLICRLYPFHYNEQDIYSQLARGCPVELLSPGESLLDVLQMRLEEAQVWHQQLYDEIRAEEPEVLVTG